MSSTGVLKLILMINGLFYVKRVPPEGLMRPLKMPIDVSKQEGAQSPKHHDAFDGLLSYYRVSPVQVASVRLRR